MKRISVITLLLVFSAAFLAIQLYFVNYVPRQRKEPQQPIYQTLAQYKPTPTPPAKLDLSRNSFINVQSFASLTEQFSLKVFLVDPDILHTVMSNVSQIKSRCKYLCRQTTVTSFGIVNKDLPQEDDFIEEFKKEGFQILSFTDLDPRALSQGATSFHVHTHYLLYRGGHSIHLLIFYEMLGDFLWHGTLSWAQWAKGDPEEVKVNLSHMSYGKFPGAYDKIEVVKVQMDGIALLAPRFPTLLLKQIPHARFMQCNHSRATHFMSRYPQDAHADALRFRKKARNLIAKAKQTLDELGIRFWLSSGTCLGWFRQCDIITYSRDVDLGIWIKDYDVRLIPAMQMSGMPLKHLFGKQSDSFELSFYGGEDLKLDIFFFYEEDGHMWNGGTQVKTGKKFKYYFPKFTLCWTEFLAMKVRIPCESESYISANYGPDWFTPVKVWDWKRSPPNVKENGVWSEREREKVIQIF